MSTNSITPTIDYSNVSESTPYNFNVPVKSELEIDVEFFDGGGNDVTNDINYTLNTSKSMGSALFDTNTVSIEWVGAGSLPVTNKLRIYRRTSLIQQTVFELGADISIETESELDRLSRLAQDQDFRLTETEDDQEIIESLVNDHADILEGYETEIAVSDGVYFGDKTSNGSFRIIKSGSQLAIQQRIGGVWTNKDIIG